MGIEHKETSGQPMPTEEAEYVVIGLTNGPGFHANPCLADQVAWARERGLLVAAYSVDQLAATRRAASDAVRRRCAEAGYQQARFNVASMEAAGLDSPLVWLDVEPVPLYEWSGQTRRPTPTVVLGAAQGYLDAGYRIGVYSTPHSGPALVGRPGLGVPEWRAAGQTSQGRGR